MKKRNIKHLFIDSNVWLSLYQLSSNDLSRFEKIKDSIGIDFCLYVPKQVVDEVLRNRETKLKDSFPKFKNFELFFPNYCKGYDEYNDFKKDYDDLKKRHDEWIKQIDNDIKSNNLKADIVVNDIFEKSGIIDVEKYVDLAYVRYKKGNPPGKENKYGDAINWECLLDVVPNNCDLYFISDDKDYKSPVVDKGFNFYLLTEWKTKKNGVVYYYNDLVTFLTNHAEYIRLLDEIEKRKLIQELFESQNFHETHEIIKKMSDYDDWSDDQVKEICYIGFTNNQVSSILGDSDIFKFYSSLVKRSDEELSVFEKIKKYSDSFI